MHKQLITVLFFSIIIIFLSSCGKDENNPPNYFNNIDCISVTQLLDTIHVDENAKEYLKFGAHQKLFFKNEAGAIMQFEKEIVVFNNISILQYSIRCKDLGLNKYICPLKNEGVTFFSYQGNIRLSASVYVSPFIKSDSLVYANWLSYSLYNTNTSISFFDPVTFYGTNREEALSMQPSLYLVEKMDSVKLLGKKFENVTFSSTDQNHLKNTLYINEEIGMCAFIDDWGVLWVYDHAE